MANDNYPDDIRQFDDHPGSPFYDDSGFESAVDEVFDELLDDSVKVAEIVSEMTNAKYDELMKAVYESFSDDKLALVMIDYLHDAEPQLFQEALTDNKKFLNDKAVELIDDAVYEYAENIVLKQK